MEISPAQLAGIRGLQECYREAADRKGGLIDFTKSVRRENADGSGKYSIKPTDLTALFSQVVWKEIDTKNGHRKIKNIFTDVVVEYSNHVREIKAGAVVTILDAVQKHLNILGNEIFAYTVNNFKQPPDYVASYERWLKR